MPAQTIFAVASGAGRAGVAVVRVSGPNAVEQVGRLCKLPAARQHRLSEVRSLDGELLDQALVLFFPKGASFTGEDIVELQLHGSPAILARVLNELSLLDGLRPAEPGEFTRRAFENDQLDLTQVEALADLIDADTEQQRLQAMRVFGGGLRDFSNDLRKDLIRAAALIEATIDFADEEVPTDVSPEVSDLISKSLKSLRGIVERSSKSKEIRTGVEVAIIGKPNVGKSTLLNMIAGRAVALTSDIPGTTRDAIEVRIDLSGFPVTFVDTAGVRDTEDEVEKAGVTLSSLRATEADVSVFLIEDTLDEISILPKKGDIVIFNKADQRKDTLNAVSGETGLGLDALLEQISAKVRNFASEDVVSIRERHTQAFSSAIQELETSQDLLQYLAITPEIVVAHLYAAAHDLGLVIGAVGVENILDEVFSSFCLGK